MGPIWMTLLLGSMLGFFSWSAFRRMRQVKIGCLTRVLPGRASKSPTGRRPLLVYAFGQRKMPYYTLAGFAHVGIFVAFQVLLLNSLMLWGRGFEPGVQFLGPAEHRPPLRQAVLIRQRASLPSRRSSGRSCSFICVG